MKTLLLRHSDLQTIKNKLVEKIEDSFNIPYFVRKYMDKYEPYIFYDSIEEAYYYIEGKKFAFLVIKESIHDIRSQVLAYVYSFMRYKNVKEIVYFDKSFDRKSFFEFLYQEILNELHRDLADSISQMRLIERRQSLC